MTEKTVYLNGLPVICKTDRHGVPIGLTYQWYLDRVNSSGRFANKFPNGVILRFMFRKHMNTMVMFYRPNKDESWETQVVLARMFSEYSETGKPEIVNKVVKEHYDVESMLRDLKCKACASKVNTYINDGYLCERIYFTTNDGKVLTRSTSKLTKWLITQGDQSGKEI